MRLDHLSRPSLPRRQRGIAAILLVLLVGLSLTVTVLGTMHYVRAEQDSALTTHAVTTAQMKAWNGVEAFRQYLNTLGQTQAATLPTTAPNNVVTLADVTAGGNASAGISGVITAVAAKPATCSSGTQVTASFTGTNATSNDIKSSSTVEAVFCVTTTGGGSSTPPGGLGGGMVIHGNLTTSGNIKFAGDTSANITVIGNLVDSGTLDGINNLYTTGSVNLSSTGSVQNILAQGDVTIGNSATFQSVSSQGNVSITNVATITTVNANGSVTVSNSANLGTVNALGGAVANGKASTTTVGTGGVTTSGGAKINYVNTNGNLSLSNATVKNLAAAGSLLFKDGYSSVAAGTVGTGFAPTGNNGLTHGSNVTLIPNFMPTYATNTVPVPGITMPTTPTIDAWANRAQANYAFDVDNNGYVRVNIANVNMPTVNGSVVPLSSGAPAATSSAGTAIPAGAWYVLSDGAANQDMLCPTSTYSSATCTVRVCYAGTLNNSCFVSQGGGGNSKKQPGSPQIPLDTSGVPTWSLADVNTAGEALPPGLVWFRGTVNLGLGTWFNTVIATGNITTSANNLTYAPNYVGYGNATNPNPNAKIGTAGICVNNPFNTAPEMLSSYPAQNLYPTNLCPTPINATCVPTASNNYCGYQGAAIPLANIALYAGGYTPGSTVFTGGTVTLGASTQIFGNVISADTVSFGGSTYVAGYVNAFQQSQTNTSSFGASTTIDLTNYPPTFNPCVSLGGCTPGGGGTAVTTTTVFWTRYK